MRATLALNWLNLIKSQNIMKKIVVSVYLVKTQVYFSIHIFIKYCCKDRNKVSCSLSDWFLVILIFSRIHCDSWSKVTCNDIIHKSTNDQIYQFLFVMLFLRNLLITGQIVYKNCDFLLWKREICFDNSLREYWEIFTFLS